MSRKKRPIAFIMLVLGIVLIGAIGWLFIKGNDADEQTDKYSIENPRLR